MTQPETNEVNDPIRIDTENEQIVINETAVVLRGEDGRKIPIDHISEKDGYVAFAEENLHLTFEEVNK